MIKRLWNLHIGLIKYIYAELKQKKTVKELLVFFKNIGGKYIKVLSEEYKALISLLDPQYRKQRKEYERVKNLKQDFYRALKLLKYLDEKMTAQGMPSWKRKQFWRDFFKNGQVRKEEFETLLKEIG